MDRGLRARVPGRRLAQGQQQHILRREASLVGTRARDGRDVFRANHTVATGRFGAQMAVELVNDGPVTIVTLGQSPLKRPV